MDLNLIRTFVEVVDAGSFVRAAERLNVTQSTVSTRIKELEGQLGRELFARNRSGATLTGAGLRFQPHARTLLRSLQEARLDVALPERFRAILTVGAQYSLWDGLLVDWLMRMTGTRPDVALRAEVGQPEGLVRQLYEGSLDIGVMYAPQIRAGLATKHLLTDVLQLVATPDQVARGGAGAGPGSPGYVLVDWGPEFRIAHDRAFNQTEAPALAFGLGALALKYIVEQGGSGYFPQRIAQPSIEAGAMVAVPDVPEFHRPAFAVFRAADEDPVLADALEIMSALAVERLGPVIDP